jgi:hypothetical protein
LAEHSDGSLDEDLRGFDSFLPKPLDEIGHLLPALDFESLLLTGGDVAQPTDHSVPIGNPARPNVVRDAGGEDLLGAAAADLKQGFKC